MTAPRELLSLRAILKTHVVAVNCCQSAKTAGMSVASYRMNRLTEPRNIDEVANLATQQQSQILFRVFPQCWCGMALGSAQDENRTNKIASWSDGFTMRAVFHVKKRKSVLKLIVALSLPLFVWLSASAQTTNAEKPSITEKIGLPGHPLPNYKPVTGPERFKWFVKSTVGPSSLFLWTPERRPGDSD